MRSEMALLLLLTNAAACSSSKGAPSGGQTPGTAIVDGTLTFIPSHYLASAAASQVDSNHVSIVVTSLRGTDSCATVEMSVRASVANVFQVAVAIDRSDAKTIISPGVHKLGDKWQAAYNLADVKCAAAGQETATTGSLEIDSVDTSIHGIADMTFPTGRVIANFDAPLCKTATGTGTGSACATFPLCPAAPGTDLDPAPTETCNQFP
jgi:hypothetical protein